MSRVFSDIYIRNIAFRGKRCYIGASGDAVVRRAGKARSSDGPGKIIATCGRNSWPEIRVPAVHCLPEIMKRSSCP